MKASLLGSIVGGVIASLASVFLDSIVVFFAGVAIAGAISGWDKKIMHRLAGLVMFYIVSAAGFFVHTALFKSNALFGVLALIVYSPIVLVLFLACGWLISKVKNIKYVRV